MDLPQVEPFEAKFEDVNIYVHNIKLTEFEEEEEPETRFTALTDVRHDGLVKHYVNNEEGRSLVGQVMIIYRNQGNHFPSIMMLICSVSAISENDKDGASLFCKLIQYLMDWTGEYVKNNEIKDMTGKEDFVMPAFHYAKDQFPSLAG